MVNDRSPVTLVGDAGYNHSVLFAGVSKRVAQSGAFALLLLPQAGCHSPTGVALDALDPRATFFVWLTKTGEGTVREGALVARDEATPALLLEGEELFVFPVRPTVFSELGIDPRTIPAHSPITEALPCEPAIVPREFYVVRGEELVPSPDERVSVTSMVIRGCPAPRPEVRFHGFTGRNCVPEWRSAGACEWEAELDSSCRLSPDQLRWRLFSFANEGACATPVPAGSCVSRPGSGRILAETECTPGRAVLSRPADTLSATVVTVPGNPAPSYTNGSILPGDTDQLYLRIAYVPDLLRRADGTLLVASSSQISDATNWRRNAETTLHLFDPSSLAHLGSSEPIPFILFGLLADPTSENAVLAAVTSTQPDTLRFVRYRLDGTALESQTIGRLVQDTKRGDHLRYVDAFFSPELDAVVTFVSYQVRQFDDTYRNWVEVTLLDPASLDRRASFDTQSFTTDIYAAHALYAPIGDRPAVLAFDDEEDWIVHLSFDADGPLVREDGFKIADGGAATVQHGILHRGPDGAERLFGSISSHQKSWRRVFNREFEMQFAAEGIPTLTASLGADLLLAPALEPMSGDLHLLLLEPTRLDVFRATAPVLRGLGPAGREVHDDAGTVWMTLPWTGRLARVSQLPD